MKPDFSVLMVKMAFDLPLHALSSKDRSRATSRLFALQAQQFKMRE